MIIIIIGQWEPGHRQAGGRGRENLEISKLSEISFFEFPKQKTFKNTVLFKAIYYYNQISSEIRKLSSKHFKSKLKKERHLLKQIQD